MCSITTHNPGVWYGNAKAETVPATIMFSEIMLDVTAKNGWLKSDRVHAATVSPARWVNTVRPMVFRRIEVQADDTGDEIRVPGTLPKTANIKKLMITTRVATAKDAKMSNPVNAKNRPSAAAYAKAIVEQPAPREQRYQ